MEGFREIVHHFHYKNGTGCFIRTSKKPIVKNAASSHRINESRRQVKKMGIPRKSLAGIICLIVVAILVSNALPAKKTDSKPVPDSLKQGHAPSSNHCLQPAETLVTTNHVITINGKQVRYTATAGLMKIVDSAGNPIANIFFTAYFKQPEAKVNRRPIAFAFNGGPGASSMWLHLAAIGPKRALFGENGIGLPGTDTLVNNDYTWLPFTDLVFVDPVGTGYSRSALGVDAHRFYSVNSDIRIMADFIRLFLTMNQRWTSPLFLIGESYGTFRAAGLSQYLQSNMSKSVNGIILVSSVLNFQFISFDPGNDLAFVLALPSYASAAWFHKQLPAFEKSDLDHTLGAARKWAESKYLIGLSKGSALTEEQRKTVADSLSVFTGLPESYVLEHGLRVSPFGFVRQLLARQHQSIGILDARETAINAPPVDPHEYRDPSFFVVAAPLTDLTNNYLRKDLAFSTSLEYVFLSEDVNRQWQWSEPSTQGYVDRSSSLREAMSVNKKLRVFAAMGLFDLVTPCESQRYGFEHLASDSSFMQRIQMKAYPSGHQLYTHIPSLRQFTGDVEKFVLNSSGGLE